MCIQLGLKHGETLTSATCQAAGSCSIEELHQCRFPQQPKVPRMPSMMIDSTAAGSDADVLLVPRDGCSQR